MKKLSVFLIGMFAVFLAQAASTDSPQASALRAKFTSLADNLQNNPYKRPIYIESAEKPDTLSGDVYAVLDYPFTSVSAVLSGPARWCDIMIMPINTKDCRVPENSAGSALTVRIGIKYDQPIRDAYPIEFNYRLAQASPEYFAVRLDAESGPLSTRDYRVLAEAVPGDNGKTFLHLRYSYGYGMMGRLAMQAYLATVGAGKVGFTPTANGLIKGMRGVVERNTMRYYLAIDAFLSAAGAPAGQKIEQRLATWFDSTEQYARQLHEIDRPDYLAMKRREVLRQQTALEGVSGSSGPGRL